MAMGPVLAMFILTDASGLLEFETVQVGDSSTSAVQLKSVMATCTHYGERPLG